MSGKDKDVLINEKLPPNQIDKNIVVYENPVVIKGKPKDKDYETKKSE